MDVQQLINYEATLQFAMGDVLRDLAILMNYSEQGQPPNPTHYAQTVKHLKIFQNRLHTLEQEVQMTYKIIPEVSEEGQSLAPDGTVPALER